MCNWLLAGVFPLSLYVYALSLLYMYVYLSSCLLLSYCPVFGIALCVLVSSALVYLHPFVPLSLFSPHSPTYPFFRPSLSPPFPSPFPECPCRVLSVGSSEGTLEYGLSLHTLTPRDCLDTPDTYSDRHPPQSPTYGQVGRQRTQSHFKETGECSGRRNTKAYVCSSLRLIYFYSHS